MKTRSLKSRKFAKDMNQEKRADQSHRDATNVNTIMARYRSDSLPPPMNRRTPLYGDFTSADDLHTSLNRVHEATDAFLELPATVRAAAGNSPVQFLEMALDPEGLAYLESHGLQVEDEAANGRHVNPEPDGDSPPSKPSGEAATSSPAAQPGAEPSETAE